MKSVLQCRSFHISRLMFQFKYIFIAWQALPSIMDATYICIYVKLFLFVFTIMMLKEGIYICYIIYFSITVNWTLWINNGGKRFQIFLCALFYTVQFYNNVDTFCEYNRNSFIVTVMEFATQLYIFIKFCV